MATNGSRRDDRLLLLAHAERLEGPILREELRVAYRTIPVNIGKGDQFKPEFLAISPNNRMPAIVDRDVEGEPVPVFESGAIMFYLARKTGRFLATDPIGESERLEWLFWQVGNQGPMAGQNRRSTALRWPADRVTYFDELSVPLRS